MFSLFKDRSLKWLLLISGTLRVILALNPLSNGEAYYARGAMDFQLSYFDQPPLFLWISGISVNLFGYNNLALRLPAILLFMGTTILVYKIALDIYKSKSAAFYSSLALNVSAVFTISIGFFFQPDSPLIFFWLLSFYAFYKIIFPTWKVEDLKSFRRSKYVLKWTVVLGIAIGLTALSKYHVAFLVLGFVLFLIFNKKHWHWLRHYSLPVVTVIALILFLPVLIWNSEHDWISFVFQSSRASSSETTLRFDWLLRSILGQALWVLPWIWVPLVIQFFRVFINHQKLDQHSLLFWTSAPVVIFFTLVTLWSNLQFHFHWQAPGYLMMFIPLGYWLNKKIENSKNNYLMQSLNWTIGITLILFALLTFHIHTGKWQFLGPKWIAMKFGEKTDPTIMMNNFKAVKEKFDERGWTDDPNIFAASTRWWMSGLMDYSLKGKKPFLIINSDPRNYAYLVDPNKLLGKDCIVVLSDYENTVENDVKPFFTDVSLIDSCWIDRYDGEEEFAVQFYYCRNFQQAKKAMEHIPIYAQLKGKEPFYYLLKE